MSLDQEINKDYVAAMKEKDAEKVGTLRMLKAAIKNQVIDNKLDSVSDELVIQIVSKQIKQRNDSVDEYNKANRKDLADKEIVEIKILEVYQPEQMSKEDLEKIVDKVLAENNIQTKPQMGQAMKLIMAEVGGQADGKVINQLVAAKLN